MRTASYRVSDLQKFTIPLGFVGENEHFQIVFLAEEAYEEYPHAAVSLTVRPPYGEPYPAVVTRDGNNVLWTVKDSDLTRSGQGEIQLSFTESPAISKTYVGKTKIHRSIMPTGEVPDSIEDFLREAGAALTAIPETIDAALEAAKESGEFDGPQGPAGQDGQPGADGYSPTITVTDITGGHRLTISDKNGTRTVDVMDGEDGAPGQDGAAGADGFSPVITVTDITGGHRLTITTATETQTVDVMDGSGGDPTEIIDDTAGSGDTDKVWSADKSSELLSAIDDLHGGFYYLNSEIVSGYLKPDGTIGEYNKRATFSDYMSMPVDCFLQLDTGYAGTYCTYNSSHVLQDRSTINNGTRVFIPKNTIFRFTIFDSPEQTISDVSTYKKKCHLVVFMPYCVTPLTGGDLNNITENGIYITMGTLPSNVPISYDRESGLFGVLTVYRYGGSNTVYQSYLDYRNYYYTRDAASGTWSAWVQYARQNSITTINETLETVQGDITTLGTKLSSVAAVKPLAAKIFKRVGCIGDSYTEGYINAGGEVEHRNDCAWPHFMEQLTGNTWTNFGCGGSSTKSWIDNTNPRYSKLSDVQASGNKCQAYVIGLMINDCSVSSDNKVDCGTSADIGTTANSYYAYYYRLIQAIHTVNSDAPIFCNTCPKSDSKYTAYNQAVRDIVTYCKQNDLPVYLCDLAGETYFTDEYFGHPVYTSDNINGHYTSIGYEMMAECYLRVLSDIILANVSDFQTVHLIDYDEPSTDE